MGIPFAHVDHVLHGVRCQDEERLLAAADPESLALPDGVEVGAVVLADLLAVAHRIVPRFGQGGQLFVRGLLAGKRYRGVPGIFRPRGEDLVDVAALRGELLLEEDRQINLPDKADPLRILAARRGQPLFGGNAPYLGLQQPPDREQRPAQLLLRKLAEKVALILVGVGAGQQPVDDTSVREPLLGLAAVVARGDVVGPELQRLAQEDVELDLAVAQHVGIGRAAAFVLGEHVVHHPRAVVGREVDDVERNVELLGHQFGEEAVVVPRTVAFERARGVVPVDHEEADDLISLLLEQPGGHRRIDAARESDDYPFHCFCVCVSRVSANSRPAGLPLAVVVEHALTAAKLRKIFNNPTSCRWRPAQADGRGEGCSLHVVSPIRRLQLRGRSSPRAGRSESAGPRSRCGR